jgi:lipopolysaccharide export system permease protein
MNTLDRSLFRAYLQSYVICLVSLLSLYVVVDLFMNLEDFAHQGLEAVLRHVLTYYGYKTIQIFDRLSEPIVLLAAMFTVAWVQRNNELLPLLSAGVPTRRVIRPVLIGAVLTLGLGATASTSRATRPSGATRPSSRSSAPCPRTSPAAPCCTSSPRRPATCRATRPASTTAAG